MRRPIHKIQIKIILQSRCIQDLRMQRRRRKKETRYKIQRPINPKSALKKNKNHLIRRSRNLPWSLNRTRINPRSCIIKAKRREGVHWPPGLRLVAKNIMIGKGHWGGSLLGSSRRNYSSIRAKQSGAKKGNVGRGSIFPSIGVGIGDRGNIKEGKIGTRSTGNEPIGVDSSGRRQMVINIDHAVNLARWG